MAFRSCTVPDVALNLTTIQTAVNNAADGGVVCLQAGTLDMTSGIDLSSGATKCVELRGAGIIPLMGSATSGGTTFYHNNSTASVGTYEGQNFPCVVSNIKFTADENSTLPNYGVVLGNKGDYTKPTIINHCNFEVTGRDNGPKFIQLGTRRALISRNKFIAATIGPNYINTNVEGVNPIHNDDTGAIWSSASTMGADDSTGNNNIYVETNYFEGFNVATDRNTSARVVWRFNEMHSSSMSDHGYDSSVTGERHTEIYNNTFYCDQVQINLNAWIAYRGGTGRIFNNTFPLSTNQSFCNYSGDGVGNITLAAYKLKQAIEINAWPGEYPDTYPASHQTGWGWINGSNQTVGESSQENDPGTAFPSLDGFAQALEPLYFFNNTNNTGSALVYVEDGYVAANRAMAYSNSSKASATSIVLSGYANSGQEYIVAMADKGLTGIATPSDSVGATCTALTGGTNGSLRLSAWHCSATTSGWRNVTIGFDSSTVARAATMSVFRNNSASSPVDKNPAVTNDSTSPYVAPATGTLTQENEVVVGYFALLGPTEQDLNPSSGTYRQNINDSISAGSSDLRTTSCDTCGNRIGFAGTTGGAATDNVTVAMTYRYVTATTDVTDVQISNATANRTGIAGVVTLKNSQANPDLQMTDFIQPNREFYDEEGADCSGTDCNDGVGVGARGSRPSNCVAGTAWWATDQGSWNTSGSGGQGVLDKCTATNTWTNAWYVPYSYPHPYLADFMADQGDASTRKTKRGRSRGRH